jgi:hypothetical protein
MIGNAATYGPYSWDSTPEMVADVQSWLDDPATNFGWILVGDESQIMTSKRFDSRENPLVQNRPLLRIVWSGPNSVHDPADTHPEAYVLQQNYPNPFNPVTTIGFALPRGEHVSLRVYDLLGREVATLLDGMQQPGNRTVEWDGRDNLGSPAPSGIYLYRLVTGSFATSRSMVLLK